MSVHDLVGRLSEREEAIERLEALLKLAVEERHQVRQRLAELLGLATDSGGNSMAAPSSWVPSAVEQKTWDATRGALAEGPGTLTDVANRLGISKAAAHARLYKVRKYRLCVAVRRGRTLCYALPAASPSDGAS